MDLQLVVYFILAAATFGTMYVVLLKDTV